MYLAMRLPAVRELLMRQLVAAAVAAAGLAVTKWRAAGADGR
jgi:hypothetical protein